MRKLVDVNYLGTFFAARAALPVFRRQGRGHLIIVSSIVGKRGVPYMGAYAATKFAQVGLAECLRAELAGTPIHVSVVFPVSTDTEFFDVMSRETGATVTRAFGPRQRVEEVADAIARAIERPVPEVYPLREVPRARLAERACARPLRPRRRSDSAASRSLRLVLRADHEPGTKNQGPTAMATDAQERARQIAEAVRGAGGRALVVGGWVRDRLLGPSTPRTSISRSSVSPAERLRRLLESFGRVEAVGESFQVYKAGDIDVSLPRRESKAGRGHRGFDVTGDPSMRIEDAARRRDFTINAIAWDPLTGEYLDPFDGRRDLERASVARGRPGDLRRRQPPRPARGAVRRALRADAGRGHARGFAADMPLDDLPAERDLGRNREAAARAAAVDRSRARHGSLGVVDRLFPELQALAGCPQEPEWHPEGDVWVHTLQVVDQARAPHRRPRAAAADRRDARRALPRFRQAADDGVHRRHASARSTTKSRASRRPRRFSIGSTCIRIDGYDVRRQVLGIVAQHLKPGCWFKVRDEVGDGAFRRLAQKVDLELLARVAKADCLGREPGRFDCARDGLVPRTGARARRRASTAGADSARPPPARARPGARPARR